jgi:hypothetical protein
MPPNATSLVLSHLCLFSRHRHHFKEKTKSKRTGVRAQAGVRVREPKQRGFKRENDHKPNKTTQAIFR